MGSVYEFLHQKLAPCVSVFWFSLSTLFGFVYTNLFFRLRRDGTCLKLNYNSSSLALNSEQNNKIDYNYVKAGPEKQFKEDYIDYRDSETDVLFDEKKTTQLCFNFKFPTFEEFSTSMRDNGGFVSSEDIPSISTNKKSFSAFIEELEPINFEVEEVNTEINGGSFGDGDTDDKEELMSDKDFHSLHLEEPEPEADPVREKTYEKSNNGESGKEENENKDSMPFAREKGEAIDEENFLHVSDEKEGSSSMDSDLESDGSSHDLHSVTSHLVDSFTDGFLSDGEFGGAFELYHLMEINGQKVEESQEEMSDSDQNLESQDFDDEDSDIMEEFRHLKEDHIQDSNKFKSHFLSEKDFHEESHNYKDGESSGKNDKTNNSSDNSEIPEVKNDSVLDSEDTNKLETLWEHQDLIEQLKMELKKVRATGLPTILEESESPKITEDLKPWKIDDKFQHENPIGELHKFYKSYRERMRKFDILNYQKMYAIGFLQLKDPLQSISPWKALVPDIASILSENLYPNKSTSKKNETDPMKKFINELRSDLEVVYVGQMCLSWEILHWQYGMALDLWESDPRRIRCYNEVAGEFQQFQVHVQRFIEDEPFQGPRVQNYIKHRCVLRNLLQVPVIREDISKDRKKARRRRRSEKGDYSITSDMLVEMVEESIRIFWHFVGADKDCTGASRKGLRVQLQDPADSEILKEVRKDLQKKERKLKDQLRSGNCILKKFQKCREEDNSDQLLFFFSQVDLKLVSRVLNMSRLTTDQLAWCRSKLNTISFINGKRRIHVEPSFCLFPC